MCFLLIQILGLMSYLQAHYKKSRTVGCEFSRSRVEIKNPHESPCSTPTELHARLLSSHSGRRAPSTETPWFPLWLTGAEFKDYAAQFFHFVTSNDITTLK